MTDQVREIEENIAQARQFVELNAALGRLTANRDFKAVIQDGYLQKEAVRLVHLKADPSMQTAERQASVVRDLDAIGGLLQYFRTVEHNASIAAKAIESGEETMAEILAEGA